MPTWQSPAMQLRFVLHQLTSNIFNVNLHFCTLKRSAGDSQEVNYPEGAREATLGCGPDGPRNDIGDRFRVSL